MRRIKSFTKNIVSSKSNDNKYFVVNNIIEIFNINYFPLMLRVAIPAQNSTAPVFVPFRCLGSGSEYGYSRL